MSVVHAQELIKRIATDVVFRQKVENSSPEEKKKLLAEAGYGDVTKADVEAAAQTAGTELTDAELEAVAGGRTASWVAAVSIAVGSAAGAAVAAAA